MGEKSEGEAVALPSGCCETWVMEHPKCFTLAKIRLGKGAWVHLHDMSRGD